MGPTTDSWGGSQEEQEEQQEEQEQQQEEQKEEQQEEQQHLAYLQHSLNEASCPSHT